MANAADPQPSLVFQTSRLFTEGFRKTKAVQDQFYLEDKEERLLREQSGPLGGGWLWSGWASLGKYPSWRSLLDGNMVE